MKLIYYLRFDHKVITKLNLSIQLKDIYCLPPPIPFNT